ncbi:MAG TPA: hypothetical protein PK417_11710 [Hyphomonas sp.]|nr:hypothetical protein [Hyphomonas sp.]
MLKRTVRSMTFIAATFLMLTVGGCGHDDPTQPVDSNPGDLTLSAAKVSVDGQSLDGLDIQQGEYSGPMHYEARLADHHGNPIVGGQVRVRYGMSGMMGHMGGYMHQGEFYCYDDGTHGDPVPGDGIFCFVDDAQQYGCHRAGANPGEYHYEFCGYDQHGHESNRMDVMVNLLP